MMKLNGNFKFYAFKIVISLLIFSQLRCSDGDGCGAPGPDSAGFGFKLQDITGDNLIAAWGAQYDSELVSLKNEAGEEAKFLYIGGNGNINFVIPDNIEDAMNNRISKTFFLHLPDNQGNPSGDIDTLDFEYEFALLEGSCPGVWYEYFKVSFNNSLYHEGEFETPIVFIK